MRRLPLRVLAIAMLLVLATVVVYAAAQTQPSRPGPQVTRTPRPVPTSPSPPPPAPPALDDLRAAIAAVEAQYHTSLGVGIAPVAAPGSPSMAPWQGGTLTTALAWQTIDIAIGQAVTEDPRQPQDLTYLLDRAITQGSPAGDVALWQYLGTADQAASKTETVLQTGGDWTTTLSDGALPDGQSFSVFTDIWWTLADAAQFMGGFYCMPHSWPVLTHLSTKATSPDDAFGLAALGTARVKTGYGISPGSLVNGTSVRQAGLLILSNGSRAGVSLAALADDGSLATAQAALTAVAALLPAATSLGGRC